MIEYTKDVPRRWYNAVQRARGVNERLTDRLIERDGVRSVGITSHDERIGGFGRPAIRVRLAGDAAPSVPDHVDTVPVLTERNAPEPTFQSHGSCSLSHYNRDYDPVKGGAIVEGRSNAFDDDGDCTNIGTACCRMLDVGTGTYYLMTAHHIIDGCSAGDVSGQSVYQHGDYLGTVAESYDQHDVVLVTTDWFSARSGFADEIVEATQSLSGYVTPDGLSTMAMNGESCEKRGVATGADTPTVDEWGQTLNKCNNSYPDQVEYTNASNDGGDSGGHISPLPVTATISSSACTPPERTSSPRRASRPTPSIRSTA